MQNIVAVVKPAIRSTMGSGGVLRDINLAHFSNRQPESITANRASDVGGVSTFGMWIGDPLFLC